LCCAPSPLCGNSKVDSVEEQCDDGNTNEEQLHLAPAARLQLSGWRPTSAISPTDGMSAPVANRWRAGKGRL